MQTIHDSDGHHSQSGPIQSGNPIPILQQFENVVVEDDLEEEVMENVNENVNRMAGFMMNVFLNLFILRWKIFRRKLIFGALRLFVMWLDLIHLFKWWRVICVGSENILILIRLQW